MRKLLLNKLNFVFNQVTRRWYSARLAEVGILETKKDVGQYDVGQLFLHRVFGYRGVILFPWLAQVFDRDQPKALHRISSRDLGGFTQPYYQCLIDTRDCQFIRAQNESVTFLGSRENNRGLYAIPGLDYVSHDDVLPYTTTESPPLCHELFDKFFNFENSSDDKNLMVLEQKDTLRAWQRKNRTWLELSDVHRETTEGVRVTVIPFYIGCRDMQGSSVYWWRYLIRLENLSQFPVQLRERHWRIFSLSGTLETVTGRGVIGQEPVLSPSQPAFQYASHISLQSPSGHMWGTFKMERLVSTNNNQPSFFDCRIPPFSLESREPETPEAPSTDNTDSNNEGSEKPPKNPPKV